MAAAYPNSPGYVGKAVQEGLEVAVDELNAAGGILGNKITLKVEDNADSGNETTDRPGYNSALTRNNIPAAMTANTTALRPAQQNNIQTYNSTKFGF